MILILLITPVLKTITDEYTFEIPAIEDRFYF